MVCNNVIYIESTTQLQCFSLYIIFTSNPYYVPTTAFILFHSTSVYITIPSRYELVTGTHHRMFIERSIRGLYKTALIEPGSSKEDETKSSTTQQDEGKHGNKVRSIEVVGKAGESCGINSSGGGGADDNGDDGDAFLQPSFPITPEHSPNSSINCDNNKGLPDGLTWTQAHPIDFSNTTTPFSMSTFPDWIREELKLLLQSKDKNAMLAFRFSSLTTHMPFANTKGDEVLLLRRRNLLHLLRAIDPSDPIHNSNGVICIGHPGIGKYINTFDSELYICIPLYTDYSILPTT